MVFQIFLCVERTSNQKNVYIDSAEESCPMIFSIGISKLLEDWGNIKSKTSLFQKILPTFGTLAVQSFEKDPVSRRAVSQYLKNLF